MEVVVVVAGKGTGEVVVKVMGEEEGKEKVVVVDWEKEVAAVRVMAVEVGTVRGEVEKVKGVVEGKERVEEEA
jgi:hypothetical protein